MIQYQIEIHFGWKILSYTTSEQLLHVYKKDDDYRRLVADKIATEAAYKLWGDGYPIDAPGQRPWVLVVNKELSGVLGASFSPISKDLFERDKSSSNLAICHASLMPARAIPESCDKPGCTNWATYHFGIKMARSADMMYKTFWGKGVGDKLHACQEHALEIYRMDDHFPSMLQKLQ